MKSRFGTYVNAVLLILVFSMSTVISFACTSSSVFHQMHHHSSSEHSSQPSKDHDHSNPSPAPSGEDQKSDCCSNYLVEWEKVEKYASRNISAPLAVFIPASIMEFPGIIVMRPPGTDSPPRMTNHAMASQKQDVRFLFQIFRI